MVLHFSSVTTGDNSVCKTRLPQHHAAPVVQDLHWQWLFCGHILLARWHRMALCGTLRSDCDGICDGLAYQSVAILLVNNPTALAYLDLSHPCHFFHALYDYTGYTGSSTCTVIENQRVHNQTLALPESCHPIYNIYNQKL